MKNITLGFFLVRKIFNGSKYFKNNFSFTFLIIGTYDFKNDNNYKILMLIILIIGTISKKEVKRNFTNLSNQIKKNFTK